MITTSNVVAETEVDYGVSLQSGAMESVHTELRKRVVAEGENIGAFIRMVSVRIEQRHDERTSRIFVRAYWCPNPEFGCEFRGGPHDGEIINLTPGPDGRPPIQFRTMGLPAKPELTNVSYPQPSVTFAYDRAGIETSTDTWVYQLVTPKGIP